jgi:tRNA (cytidine/uridine-2'-O-)-methyltransferase
LTEPAGAGLTSTSLHVVLVAPEIHWNTGNAGRTCLAAGATLHLVKPLGFSLDAKEVKRAGLDYWPRVLLRLWDDWSSLEARLSELGEPFLVSPEGERRLWDVDFPDRTVLVFGAETSGLPFGLRDRYRDRLVSLPMRDHEVRSLNLSTTVGIALYEVLRQHRARTVLAPNRERR